MTRDQVCAASLIHLDRFYSIPTLAVPEEYCGMLPHLILVFFRPLRYPSTASSSAGGAVSRYYPTELRRKIDIKLKERYEGVRFYLSSRTVSRQVLSALCSLTSVFGMGTGGPCTLMKRTSSYLSIVFASTYLPGQSPVKYCRHYAA